MKNSKIKIGILGGFGPLSSEVFLRRFLYRYIKFTGAKYDHDFPQILYFSTYLNNLSEKGVIDKLGIKKELKQKLEVFIENKCKIILVICVSVMDILQDIKLPGRTRLINLVEITNKHLNNKRFANKRILVLCSDSTRRNKLFKSSNCFLVYPDSSEQKDIDRLIVSAISNKIYDDKSLHKLIKHYKPDFILLGCTDLSHAIHDNKTTKIAFIDPLNLSIERCLKLIVNHKES